MILSSGRQALYIDFKPLATSRRLAADDEEGHSSKSETIAMTRRPMFAPLSSLMLFGCDAVDTMKSGFEHATAVSTDLEKSIGVEPFVGFNWSNGSLAQVTITFETIPEGKSLEDIVRLSRGAVQKHFNQTPKQIVVAFSISQ